MSGSIFGRPYRERMKRITVAGETFGASSIRMSKQGHVFRIAVKADGADHKGGGGRGKVVGFSKGSRRRLIEKMARLEVPENGSAQFITLTYHNDFPDCDGARANWRAFSERLRRRWASSSGVWRMELQKRGAPHFHIVAFGLPEALPQSWVLDQWRAVTGDDTITEVSVKPLDGWKAILGYVSKYVAKVSDSVYSESPDSLESLDGAGLDHVTYPHASFETVGRVWGVYNSPCLPWAALEVFEWSVMGWLSKLKRAVNGFLRAKRRAIGKKRGWSVQPGTSTGFLLLSDNPSAWFDLALSLSL